MDWHLPHQNPATDIPVWTREGVWLTDDSGDTSAVPEARGAPAIVGRGGRSHGGHSKH